MIFNVVAPVKGNFTQFKKRSDKKDYLDLQSDLETVGSESGSSSPFSCRVRKT